MTTETSPPSPALLTALVVLLVAVHQARVTAVVLHDCFPETHSPHTTLSEAACKQRHCDWNQRVPRGQPFCALSPTHGARYSQSHRVDHSSSLQVDLTRQGTAPFGADFVRPSFRAEFLSDSVVRFTFDDSGASPPRYRVPMDLNRPSGGARNPLYDLKVTSTNPFSFKVIRKTTGTAIIDTTVGGLVLSDQYLQLATKLPSRNIYGFGENVHRYFRHHFDFRPWHESAFPGGSPAHPYVPLYGLQPFYTCVEDGKGNTHGVFLLNSNAQDFTLTNEPMLTWRTIGGVLDFYVFLGPSPENVVQQYTQLVGLPAMPPYWGLGFQLSRWGYHNVTHMQRVVSDNLKYGIPLDVQVADIDYMHDKRDFTVDTTNFAGLNDYWQGLRAQGMRTIYILDPAIAKVDNYEPYEKLKQVHGNVQWARDAHPDSRNVDSDRSLLGHQWPSPMAVYPDFFKNATRQVWKELIVANRHKLIFDGLWIDMNEPTNQGGLTCPTNKWDDPPYRPFAVTVFDTHDTGARMSHRTICMNTVQGNHGQYRHYDVHSLYGWSQTSATKEAVEAATGERSLVLTRSNFAGSGHFASHWLGDNSASWENLRYSIIGMLEYNLFGIPHVGADICGFGGHASEELCLRWMQLGAFYPFSRNHNIRRSDDQDPASYGKEFAAASREILETRYWLLPYLYTLFHQAHTQGGTVARPLHHEFPTDSSTLGIDRQFLWGAALLISPILDQGQKELHYYLPAGRWYDFFTGVAKEGPSAEVTSVTHYSKPGLHMRAGYILPLQRPANNTAFSRRNPFTLRVLLDAHGHASGSLLWDDGTSIDTYERGNYFLADFTFKDGDLQMKVRHSHGVPETNSLYVEAVAVYGVGPVSHISISSSHHSHSAFTKNYNAAAKVLQLTSLHLPLQNGFTISFKAESSLIG